MLKRPNGAKSYYYGSYFGLLFTLLASTIWFGYLFYLIRQMMGLKLDKFVNENSANDFDDLSEMYIKDFNYLPSIEIRLIDNT